MFFQRIKTPGIAHNAYMLADSGIAAVIDPARDVYVYLELARRQGATLRFVFETHRQEDFVAGAAALRRLAGAAIIGGCHPLFAHADRRLADGEEVAIGGLALRALETPGHTPESISYAAFLPELRTQAWGVFTGDALFVGATGRTDLAGEAQTASNAGILYDSIHRKLLPLGNQALLFTAHGAGSVCGGHIADRDDSTLGLERLTNPAFTLDRDNFIRHKLGERISRPPYFGHMERVNLEGGLEPRAAFGDIRILQPEEFARGSQDGLVIDTRLPEAFAGGHIPGAYSIWLEGLPIFGGWVADADTSVYLVLEKVGDLEAGVQHLGRIGIDRIDGMLSGGFEAWRNAGLPVQVSGTAAPSALADRVLGCQVLDVREASEYEAGHIARAQHMHVGDLVRHPDRLGIDVASPILVTCSVGHRASLAVSALLRRGHSKVLNLLGGMSAWSNLKLPLERGQEHVSD